MALPEIECRHCRKKPASRESGIWPFCSTRCKQLDLGAWAREDYRVPGEAMVREDNLLRRDDDEEVDVG